MKWVGTPSTGHNRWKLTLGFGGVKFSVKQKSRRQNLENIGAENGSRGSTSPPDGGLDSWCWRFESIASRQRTAPPEGPFLGRHAQIRKLPARCPDYHGYLTGIPGTTVTAGSAG